MRILIVTQWYPPEPAVLMQELAQSLQARGHELTVLTGFPNYPSGSVYPGYRVRPWRREVAEGVRVVRVALYPEHSASALKRAANYASFALSCALLAPLLVRRPDVMFVYHPPLTVGVAAVWLSWLWRAPFVYQIQDLWPDTLAATGMVNSPRALAWIGRVARVVYARADALCVTSPGFKDRLVARAVPEGKVHAVSNWVDPARYRPTAPDQQLAESLGLAGRFNVVFAGNMGKAQGLEAVVEAASLLKDRPGVQFVFVGDGLALQGLRDLARDRHVDNVRFIGRRPPAEMPALFALADALLIHLKDDPLFRITIPHKTFAYLASGKPVLAAAAGDLADLVQTTGAGLVCAPERPEALADAVRRLHDMPPAEREQLGRNGLAAVHRDFAREHLVGRIEAMLAGARSGQWA
jgi:glycosyltransferase involved in cell wall biosynthesis